MCHDDFYGKKENMEKKGKEQDSWNFLDILLVF